MNLNFGLEFTDLYYNLDKINNTFVNFNTHNTSDLIGKAIIIEQFLIELFNLEIQDNDIYDKLYQCNKTFIQKVAKNPKTYNPEIENFFSIQGEHIIDIELQLAQIFLNAYQNETELLAKCEEYVSWAIKSQKHTNGILFKTPYVESSFVKHNGLITSKNTNSRDGFNFHGWKPMLANYHANYCIYCHQREKDTCSKGYNEHLKGCPLSQKISEMNFLRRKGKNIAALAVITLDNPMVAATGYRICNDCMKSCIFQKQEPVNIPMVESQILLDVLNLPWGFEIYSLLTRWNPLNTQSKEQYNNAVLIVGMGPAGFTLAHYLLQYGITVVGIDGVKMKPYDVPFEPIKNIEMVDLEDKEAEGFGGVMDYGITVRWNKNLLSVIRIILSRQTKFKMYDGIFFGGNIDHDSAYKLGFDHIAFATGAGYPQLLDMENTLIKGVRTASDFLMSLHLNTAYQKNNLIPLQIRSPIVVIGGGLTAVDAATEALAYYKRQVTFKVIYSYF